MLSLPLLELLVPNELSDSWWEQRARKIVFSSKEMWLYFSLVYLDSLCWCIRYMYAQDQIIGKQSYGGGQKGLRDSFFKGNRIYPPTILQTPHQKV